MPSLDQKIEKAIENLPEVPLPKPVLERVLRQIYKPAYNFTHLLLVFLTFIGGEIILSKSFLKGSMALLVYFLFGTLTSFWAFLWSYQMVIERQTQKRDFGKKINQLLDSLHNL